MTQATIDVQATTYLSPIKAFGKLYSHIRTNGVVTTDTPTMGGMWSVSRWELCHVEAQMMDEGYTQVLLSQNFGFRLVLCARTTMTPEKLELVDGSWERFAEEFNSFFPEFKVEIADQVSPKPMGKVVNEKIIKITETEYTAAELEMIIRKALGLSEDDEYAFYVNADGKVDGLKTISKV